MTNDAGAAVSVPEAAPKDDSHENGFPISLDLRSLEPARSPKATSSSSHSSRHRHHHHHSGESPSRRRSSLEQGGRSGSPSRLAAEKSRQGSHHHNHKDVNSRRTSVASSVGSRKGGGGGGGAVKSHNSHHTGSAASIKVVDDANTSFVPYTAPVWVLGVAVFTMLATGSFDSIITKLMNKKKLPPCDGCEPQYFEAPFYQTWTMYLGETLCLFAYYIDMWVAKKRNTRAKMDFPTSALSFSKPKCPKILWAIPSILDFITTTLINYAFVFAQVSTVQLLRNLSVVVTALLSLVYVRVALRRHQIIGVVTVTLGLVITGLYAILNPDEETNYANTAYVGILMALVGTLISGFQFVFEESLFRKYSVSPLEAVGLMGVFGTVIGSIVLVICEFIPGAEKTSETFYMMGLGGTDSAVLIIANISFVLSVSAFNASSLMVSKLGSALLRTVVMAARTFSIWALELIIGWNTFNGLSFAGLLVVLLGVLSYNYNYMIPRDCNPADYWLRDPVFCCQILKHPDSPNEERFEKATPRRRRVSLETASGERKHHGGATEAQSPSAATASAEPIPTTINFT